MTIYEDVVTNRYKSGDYAKRNPDWDSADSPWKAQKVLDILTRHAITPQSLVEIGCGAGGVLAALRAQLPDCQMTGFDIAPDLASFWRRVTDPHIKFVLGDYFSQPGFQPDLTLVLDVIEHLADPFEFLVKLQKQGGTVIFHFPLDLSAVSVLREKPLLHVREKVGHIHYFTKGLALSLLEECGYDIIEAIYSGASFDAPGRTVKTRAAAVIRRAINSINRDIAVRLLGGDTLFVLAKAKFSQ